MVTLVDYGLGNVQAFVNVYKRLNIEVSIARSPVELSLAEKIVLPGVGAFDWAMQKLQESGMREMLDEVVLIRKRPVLGVCVGMQMMARRSDEGRRPGLGWIDGEVRHFHITGQSVQGRPRLPHMGWNDVTPVDFALFRGLNEWRFYFLHSYYFIPDLIESVAARTDYHGMFASAVRKENVFGVQFHPEKSHQWGSQLLKNFAEMP